jgi:hypothetical protein
VEDRTAAGRSRRVEDDVLAAARADGSGVVEGWVDEESGETGAAGGGGGGGAAICAVDPAPAVLPPKSLMEVLTVKLPSPA